MLTVTLSTGTDVTTYVKLRQCCEPAFGFLVAKCKLSSAFVCLPLLSSEGFISTISSGTLKPLSLSFILIAGDKGKLPRSLCMVARLDEATVTSKLLKKLFDL